MAGSRPDEGEPRIGERVPKTVCEADAGPWSSRNPSGAGGQEFQNALTQLSLSRFQTLAAELPGANEICVDVGSNRWTPLSTAVVENCTAGGVNGTGDDLMRLTRGLER